MIHRHSPYILLLLILSCKEAPSEKTKLFTKISSEKSGIDFENNLSFDKDFNIFTYRNFYNGGGVGLGDFNNDGLLDIYFTSNQSANQLYLNQGDLKFENITQTAGVGGKRAWSTGVSLVDINADGYLDIYVCNSGDVTGDNKQNELFINNGDLTFTERAAGFNLADPGFSTHAAFFDYDKDGDLDMYLLNNSYQAIGSFDLRRNERPKRDSVGGDKLFRNDQGVFSDVSEEAGIYGSVIGFGLGVTVGDINGDGWEDIYVSNDFFERDYLYLNNQDGSFREVLEEQIRSISAASMGADLSDINNDGRPDIFVTDMLPEQDARVKTVTTFENWDKYQYNIDNGYYHQFTRNMLQLNNGDNTFSEIGRLAGVEATDWSWGALIFDFQNDGLKDIFIANGIYQDLTDQDFLHYVKQEDVVKKIITNSGVDYESLIHLIPSQPIPNYAYSNEGGLRFENRATQYGLDDPGFSNGAAYGDLDNDGDLDLVVNNVNLPAWLFENKADILFPLNNYLRVELLGLQGNRQAFGTKIQVFIGGKSLYLENMPIRGFQSTVDNRPLFGLGQVEVIDSVKIYWNRGSIEVLKNIPVNQTLKLREKETAEIKPFFNGPIESLFEQKNIDFTHQENQSVDFDRDRLLYHMRSTEGPCVCVGDVNNDNLDDFYIGGGPGQQGRIYLQNAAGNFSYFSTAFSGDESQYEDVACAFFDANGDGKPDLYVASGGSEYSAFSSALGDRIYLNTGRGFTKKQQVYPNGKYENSSSVTAMDVDNDGDLDLFVGIRALPGNYGIPTSSYVLINDGSANFTADIEKSAPFKELGMVTDAASQDLNGDGTEDLLVVGEWMPFTFFSNQNGNFVRDSLKGLEPSNGWWNTLEVADFNGDSQPDFVVGNHGLNSRFHASKAQPVRMFVADFDQNGSIEQIITQYNGIESYPLALRHDLMMQMPGLKKKYLEWNAYQNQEITDIFTEVQLDQALKLSVEELRSGVYLSGSNGYTFQPFPIEAQFSVIFALEVVDINADGLMDILVGGNLNRTKPEVGKYDANYGLVLLGNGDGSFRALSTARSGFRLEAETRSMASIQTADGIRVIVANNNGPAQIFSLKKNVQ